MILRGKSAEAVHQFHIGFAQGDGTINSMPLIRFPLRERGHDTHALYRVNEVDFVELGYLRIKV